MVNIPKYISSIPRYQKMIILIVTDIIILLLGLWTSFSLRLGEFYFIENRSLPLLNISNYFNINNVQFLFTISPFIAIPVFIKFGLYRAVLRYTSSNYLNTIIKAVFLYSMLWASFLLLSGISGVPRSVIIINPLITFIYICAVRHFARYFLNRKNIDNLTKTKIRKNVLIYGAGQFGRQLSDSMFSSNEFKLYGFVDDNVELQDREMCGVPVIGPAKLLNYIYDSNITDILLALPFDASQKRKDILNKLREYPVRVRTIPRINDFIGGRVTIDDLHDLDVNDLLGRVPVEPDTKLIKEHVRGKIIMVTGAGGSIGSEICKQLIMFGAKSILLIDINEYSIYKIYSDITKLKEKLNANNSNINTEIFPIVGSITDESFLNKLMKTWKPNLLYHAAAYKHVPLVEYNTSEGLKNNVYGTLAVARAAIENNVSDFVLVSTDKAVRPTNIMGASKRMSEIILQAISKLQSISQNDCNLPKSFNNNTCFSIVRFGNVLGSSGSVVPLFRDQISRGGPITLTDKRITRYFMSISEAAQLVIQAGALAALGNCKKKIVQDSEVFLLDMGDPVKIFDLAKRMIELSGLTYKNEKNPDGDISIRITNLRPGEKLYEELLIDDLSIPTSHPRILKAKEKFIEWDKLILKLDELSTYIKDNNICQIRLLLKELVEGYVPDSKVVDLIYLENLK